MDFFVIICNVQHNAVIMANFFIESIPDFDPKVMLWDRFAERVDAFFKVHDKERYKQSTVFLATLGHNTNTVLRNLTAPATPIEKPLVDLMKLQREHYAPKDNPILERCRFYTTGLNSRTRRCRVSGRATRSSRQVRFWGPAEYKSQRQTNCGYQ